MLGCIQLMGGVRKRWPAVHRWIGRVYVTAAILAGAGGLTFIVANGTIGGAVMDVGFGLYGALVVPRRTRWFGVGLLIHIALDGLDCLMM
jgi:hypothetical protein